MNTYRNQLQTDEQRIDAECPASTDASYIERAGRFSGLAHYYASSADFEAAQRQRLSRDPKALMAIFTGQIAGPSAEDLGILLEELGDYLRVRPELEELKDLICSAADHAVLAAEAERIRREEDLDAPAAAESDERYDRKVDASLIGRSDFLP